MADSIWPLRVVLCLKTGDLVWFFHCTRVNEREMNVRCISLLSVVGKIFAGILVDRVRRVTLSKGALKQGGVFR